MDQNNTPDVPYYWLGRGDLVVKFEVRPSAGQELALRWGAKNDEREAVLRVNRRHETLRAGGYDGFRWLRVPLPNQSTNDQYLITLTQSSGKAAFLAEVRLLDPQATATLPDLQPVVAPSQTYSSPGQRHDCSRGSLPGNARRLGSRTGASGRQRFEKR